MTPPRDKKPRAPTPPPIKERDPFDDDDATPQTFDGDDITKPVTLIERTQDRYGRDASYRDEMNAIKHAYDSDLAFRALYNMQRRQRRESSRSLQEIGDSALRAHQTAQTVDVAKMDELIQWKHETDALLGFAKWILGFVIAATLGSLITVVTKIYVWGESNGSLANRIDNLEKTQTRFRPEEGPRLPGTHLLVPSLTEEKKP